MNNPETDKYKNMINMYIKRFFIKNWNEADFNNPKIMLGNTGYSIEDIRQTLLMEVVVGLKAYNPNFVTSSGKGVKESTFIYRHLYFRAGNLAKKLSSHKNGYGVWMSAIEDYTEGENR